MIERTSVRYTPHREKQEHLLRLEDRRPEFMDIDAGGIACQSKAGTRRENIIHPNGLLYTH